MAGIFEWCGELLELGDIETGEGVDVEDADEECLDDGSVEEE